MSILTWLVFAAALAVLASFASGIASMVYDGEVGHYNSPQWMVWRVVFQAAAILIILFAILESI